MPHFLIALCSKLTAKCFAFVSIVYSQHDSRTLGILQAPSSDLLVSRFMSRLKYVQQEIIIIICISMQRVAAEQLQCSEEELEQKFTELIALLPGISERMHTMKADSLAKLVDDPARVAERLTHLKAIFPQANVQQMVLRDFNLLLNVSPEKIREAAEDLRDYLPEEVDVDRCFSLQIAHFIAAFTKSGPASA